MCLSDVTLSLYKLLEGHSKALYLPVGMPDPVMASDRNRVSNHRTKGERLGCGHRCLLVFSELLI